MKYNYIHFTTWNLDWWKRTCNDANCSFYKSAEMIAMWKNLVKFNLAQLHSEFVLLQEFNPFLLYDLEYNPNEDNISIYNNYHVNGKRFFFFDFGHEVAFYNKFYNKLGKDYFWGSAVIVDKKYEFIDGICKPMPLDKYKPGLMSYDFRLSEDKIVTVINYYNKARYDSYTISEGILNELQNIAKKKAENLILLAGDFNSNFSGVDKNALDKILEIGFINKTTDIGSTMLDYDFQNDHIFVNKNMNKYVTDIRKFSQWNISDHMGIKCTIKL